MELSQLGIKTGHMNKLGKKGIRSVEDLLAFVPKGYNDLRQTTGLSLDAKPCCVVIRVNRVTYYPSRKYSRGTDLVRLMGTEIETGKNVRVDWFNQNWMYETANATVKRNVLVAGKLAYDAEYQTYTILNPIIFSEKIEESLHIYPVYRKIDGVSNDWLIQAIADAEKTAAAREDSLPSDIVAETGLPTMEDTYRFLHHPNTMEEVDAGKKRLVLNDLLDFSLRNEYSARQTSVGSPFNIRFMDVYKRIRETLPFTPTEDQEKAVQTIIDMAQAGRRINALVCGDVGTGKTFVAQMAAALFAGSGYQVALLAPTQILARQHYEDFSAMFEPVGIKVAFVDSKMSRKADREKLAAGIESGDTQIVIGTQSVFSDNIHYRNLALVIADEEHKFGVCQRNALIEKAQRGVHAITMSATPIPRSLATVMYGDMVQFLSIHTRPAGRLPVKTGIAKSREAIYSFLKRQIHDGRQVYVVCPMIEKNEKLEGVQSVEEVFEDYRKAFSGTGITMETLSGKTSKEETERIIAGFKTGETDILVATTVVEVGVNVPNAAVIVIHNAERFGLAQLHQLRGRVGRGKYQSYCVLESSAKTGPARERLIAMCSTSDGFRIAQRDLQLRGAGELLGTQQSGKNKYLGLALAYPEIYARTKEIASKLLDRGLDCCKATRNITEKLEEIEETPEGAA